MPPNQQDLKAAISGSFNALMRSSPLLKEAAKSRNVKVLRSLLGPAFRGIVLQQGKRDDSTLMDAGHGVHFDWSYERSFPEMQKLYEAAKKNQWNATTDVDWSIDVDPYNTEKPILPDALIPMTTLPIWRHLSEDEKAEQRHGMVGWILSQFLHGEQGALFASAQTTECVPWMDGKLFGSTQVVDEGRHVEVLHAYLDDKLDKRYDINDNLYVIIDAIMTESAWDLKFLGMQILVEGLALGAFGAIRYNTHEPLLKHILRYIITDEARHVHYGVLSLAKYMSELSEKEIRYREEWAFEVSLLMRNRFLAHEFYDEYYGHRMSRQDWDAIIGKSELMNFFRRVMFKRIIPNLKKIGLLSDRIKPRYASIGLLQYESGKSAMELTALDLLEDN